MTDKLGEALRRSAGLIREAKLQQAFAVGRAATQVTRDHSAIEARQRIGRDMRAISRRHAKQPFRVRGKDIRRARGLPGKGAAKLRARLGAKLGKRTSRRSIKSIAQRAAARAQLASIARRNLKRAKIARAKFTLKASTVRRLRLEAKRAAVGAAKAAAARGQREAEKAARAQRANERFKRVAAKLDAAKLAAGLRVARTKRSGARGLGGAKSSSAESKTGDSA